LIASQEELRDYLMTREGAVDLCGNIMVAGTEPWVAVAHLDTVPAQPKTIIEDGDRIYAPRGAGGIGGDDRCGVYLLTRMLDWDKRPTLLFTLDEESCKGTSVGLNNLDWSAYKCFVEVDAPGYGVYYTGTDSNDTLDMYMDSLGLIALDTSYNDIAEICAPGTPPGITLGAAYYNQHSDDEWISRTGLEVVYGELQLINCNIGRLDYSILKERPKITIDEDYLRLLDGGTAIAGDNEVGIPDDYICTNCFDCKYDMHCYDEWID